MIILEKILGPLLYTPGLPELPKDVPPARSAAVSKAAQTALAPAPEAPSPFQRNFLKRLTQEEQIALENRLKAVVFSQDSLTAFKDGNWAHPVFQTKEWPLIALKAYLQGDLDEMEVSKLFLFEAARLEKDFKPHQLRDANGSSPEATQLLLDGLKIFYSQEHLEKLPPLKPEETQFFSFRFPALNKEDAEKAFQQKEIDIVNLGIHILKFPIFAIQRDDNEMEILILPPKLWNALLKSRFGENATKADPVLGYSSADVMDDPKKRILGIPSSVTAWPKKIHDFILTSHLGLFLHDQYHTLVESANPHRKIWIEIAKTGGFDATLTEELYDRNLPLYIDTRLQVEDTGRLLQKDYEQFWYSVASFTESNLRGFADPENRKKFLKVVAKNERKWKPESGYGISIKSLLACRADEPQKCSYSLYNWTKTLKDMELEGFAKKHKARLLLPPVSPPKKRKHQPTKARFAFH